MTSAGLAQVGCLAYLHTFQRDRGCPTNLAVEVPEGGISALSLAEVIGLPTERVEGVFLNHRIAGTDVMVHAGDRVAFVPQGTPASHPAFFGRFVTRE